MTLNRLIENNNKYLLQAAKRISGKKDYRQGNDLFSSTYLEIYERGIDYPKKDEDFVKWFCKYMHFRFMPGGSFTKQMKSKEYLSLDNVMVNGDANSAFKDLLSNEPVDWNSFKDFVADADALNEIEINAEGVNSATRELIDISSSLGETKTFKYIQCLEFRDTLMDYEKYLFDLYFDKGISTRNIAKMYSDEVNKVDYQSINKMVNVIKDKIKKYKWE